MMTRDEFIYHILTACSCEIRDGKEWFEKEELIKCADDLYFKNPEYQSIQPKEIYNKGWKDGAEATAYHIELCKEENPTIPMAVIEDIKADIFKTVGEESKHCDGDLVFLNWCAGLGAALDIIDKHIADMRGTSSVLFEMPKYAEPIRPKGEWIIKLDGWGRMCLCNQCGYQNRNHYKGQPNFCENCGADMRGEE